MPRLNEQSLIKSLLFALFLVQQFSLRVGFFRGELRPLRPTAFELLLVFVANPGQTLTKDEVIRRVWGCDAGDDRNFHVTLHAVRQALRESAQAVSLIVRDASTIQYFHLFNFMQQLFH